MELCQICIWCRSAFNAAHRFVTIFFVLIFDLNNPGHIQSLYKSLKLIYYSLIYGFFLSFTINILNQKRLARLFSQQNLINWSHFIIQNYIHSTTAFVLVKVMKKFIGALQELRFLVYLYFSTFETLSYHHTKVHLSLYNMAIFLFCVSVLSIVVFNTYPTVHLFFYFSFKQNWFSISLYEHYSFLALKQYIWSIQPLSLLFYFLFSV